MAKRRKSSKCPEPLNTMLDLAGAAVLGAYTRHKILRDYERGEGEESANAAMLVHGAGALRHGSDGLISLGGLYGVGSALKAIEKQERCEMTGEKVAIAEPAIPAPSKSHNHYAWRLNCEDGSACGVLPDDYETKADYNAALAHARIRCPEESHCPPPPASAQEPPAVIAYRLCRVSRLDNGQNAYYLADTQYTVGSQVTLYTEAGTVTGIVLSYEEHSEATMPVSPENLSWIIGKDSSYE